ncbi:malignant fibrous histiocytoma-amplified sequence 1 homolog [Entelurus aequoreus]|uniref:malignant fibrous histiocytoma-amplified sequence 1 homolog n=1 Tax=Entelurus aequoreus TaxID=161455 RepID=UPI002B1D0C7E|nr:malignant fibrous histiocytoma-amplified sequence 1 homolog [Entelurus aequoreus]
MRTLNENKEGGAGEENNVKAGQLWRDAALRSRKLRSDLRQLTLCSKDQDLSHIEALNLGNNFLHELPEGLSSSLNNLRVLVLRRNHFTTVPQAVFELRQLEELDLSYNQLSGVAEGVVHLSVLKKLSVSHNNIQQLPEHISALRLLEELDISFNHLHAVPASFSRLARLRTLDVDHNKLGRFPPEILALGDLEELDCSGNTFEVVPEDVAKLRSVKILWLSSLRLKSLPETFCDLQHLESLMLDGNQLTVLPAAFGNLKRLKMVNLSSNELTEFPSVLLNILGLEEIYLSRNKLAQVPQEIGQLQNLANLWLDNNAITYLPNSLVDLAKLEELVLQGNQIAVLPDDFGNLSKVNIWKVKDNPLVQPPYEVCMKGIPHIAMYQKELAHSQLAVKPRLKLVLMGLAGAGKTQLRHSVLSGSHETEAVKESDGIHVASWVAEGGLTFLVYDLSGNQNLDLIKAFFLSHGALYILVVNLKAYSSCHFYAHVGYFLHLLGAKVPGAVVLLVGTHIDRCGEVELEEKRLDIHRQVGLQWRRDAQVLISLTLNVDQALQQGYAARTSNPYNPFYGVSDCNLQQKKSRLQFLLSNRLQILSPVLSVSTETQTNIQHLREKLTFVAEHLHIFPNLHRVLPRSWQTLEELHLKSNDLWLSWWDATRLGHQVGLTEEHLHSALSYLHECGQLLYFEGNPALKDYVFHNISRLIGVLNVFFQSDVLGRLVPEVEEEENSGPARLQNRLESFLRCGLLPSTAIHLLLCPPVQTQRDLKLSMELLEKMGICYCVNKPRGNSPNGAAVLLYKFPVFVASEETEPDQSSHPPCQLLSVEQLQIRYSFPFLFPPGLFARFGVRIDSHVAQRSDGPNRILAYRGKVPVVISHRPSVGKLQADTLSIASHASLPNIWTAWQAITPLLHELNALLREWPGLHYVVHILCSKCLRRGSSNPHAFPGELLGQRRPDGLTELVCPKNGSEKVNVALVYPPTPTVLSTSPE